MKSFAELLISLSFALSTLYPRVSVASGTGPGNLSLLHILNTGVAIIYTNAVRTGTVPACATVTSQGSQNRFAIDTTTPGGKSQLAGLIAAYYSGKAVNIGGTGTCDAFYDTETISVLITDD